MRVVDAITVLINAGRYIRDIVSDEIIEEIKDHEDRLSHLNAQCAELEKQKEQMKDDLAYKRENYKRQLQQLAVNFETEKEEYAIKLDEYKKKRTVDCEKDVEAEIKRLNKFVEDKQIELDDFLMDTEADIDEKQALLDRINDQLDDIKRRIS